jgi:hypothetical protein
MKIFSVRRKIPLYLVFDGSLKIDVATQMCAVINFLAAVTWEV